MKLRITGARDMELRLTDLSRKAPKAIERAVYRFAQIEMTEMKRLVPVDTGALKGSGFVEQPVRTGNKVTLTLGFGGAAADYAIPVHEDLEAFHRVGQAKYVEQPLAESAAHFPSRVAADVADDLGMS